MGGKRPCQICKHPERAQIERLKAGGASIRSIGERFNVEKTAIWRHWAQCVSTERKGTLLVGEVRLAELVDMANAEDKTLLEYLTLNRSILVNQLLIAAEAADSHGTAFLSGKLLECLEKIGKLTGEIRQLGSTNVTNIAIFNSPAFVELQAGLVAISRQHPEARAAIVALLRKLDADAPPVTPPRATGGAYPMIEGALADA